MKVDYNFSGSSGLQNGPTYWTVHCLFSWKVTPNKMQVHFRQLFLTQLFMLFHMVASVLLSMVAFSTIFLLVKIRQLQYGRYLENWYLEADRDLEASDFW